MSMSFNTEEKHIGVVGGYGLRSLPQRRRRQSLASGGDGGDSEDLHRELVRKEIEKIRRARERERERQRENMVQKETTHMNSCDITGEEFQIVCEELWIDFNVWVSQHKNLTNSASILRSAVSRNLYPILFVAFFAVLFRWYVGAGRDACSYGFGYGVFSFMCEVLRYLGEIVVILLMSVVGFCVGMLPLVIAIIVYEFNEAFPRGGEEDEEDEEGEDTEDEDGVNHLKKE